MLIKKTIEIDNSLLETIKQIAKDNSVTEDKIINDALETIFIDDETDELVQEIDEIRADMKSGNYTEMNIDELKEFMGMPK